jgi:LytS/YehU family sensor histidine kinase
MVLCQPTGGRARVTTGKINKKKDKQYLKIEINPHFFFNKKDALSARNNIK